jgi:hypothetical protein
MSTAPNVLKMPGSQTAKPALNLPAPRIWDKNKLAEFLGVSVSWIHKRTMANAEDPIPKIPGIGRLKFDTANPKFEDWMRRQLGLVDIEVSDE